MFTVPGEPPSSSELSVVVVDVILVGKVVVDVILAGKVVVPVCVNCEHVESMFLISNPFTDLVRPRGIFVDEIPSTEITTDLSLSIVSNINNLPLCATLSSINVNVYCCAISAF